MGELVLRRIPFGFDGAEFVRHSNDVGSAHSICRALRDAQTLVTDPVVPEQAHMFNTQKSVHWLSPRRRRLG